MVVWLFSGGGEAELFGIIPFFQNNFPGCQFIRMTPARPKCGPRPGKKIEALGKTGRDLRKQIKYRIEKTPDFNKCDLILVLDDLDCRNADVEKNKFDEIFNVHKKTADHKRLIVFAAPELEAWLIADWDGTFARSIDFKNFHSGLRYTLAHDYHVPFDDPESFSKFDPAKNACEKKLSEDLMEAVIVSSPENRKPVRYSKANHTSTL